MVAPPLKVSCFQAFIFFDPRFSPEQKWRWFLNTSPLPVPVPVPHNGVENSLEDAKAAFKALPGSQDTLRSAWKPYMVGMKYRNQEFDELTSEMRPQDIRGDGTGLLDSHSAKRP